MAGSLPAKNTEASQTTKQGPGWVPVKADSSITGSASAAMTTPGRLTGQQTDTGSQQLTDAVSNPAVLATAVLVFTLVATDVAGSSQFLPRNLDQPVHRWVSSSLPVGIRSLVAEKLVSDFFITGGLVGGTLAGIAGIQRSPAAAIRRSIIIILFYCFGGGSISHGDPWLVNELKHYFHRIRPSELNNTYAFPSGHTTAATFIVGCLLFILLPAVLPARAQQTLRSIAVPLWAAAMATTATGRVLGDVHWCSDTMAGACLGTALVSLTAMLCKAAAAAGK